ncbi:MAG: hypothetical protein M1838_001905 [Thelocarpon superellum]|nr:MAG: hypothetical protein M1838_001905 [Thelocarpon superellum]
MPPASSTSATAAASRSAKASRRTLIVTLSLSPELLAHFPSEVDGKPEPRKGSARTKSSTDSSSTPVTLPADESPPEQVSDSNSTPAAAGTPTSTAAIANGATKRKGIPGPKPGTKRGAAAMADGAAKVRGKPGPKKKQKGDDGSADPTETAAGTKALAASGGAALTAHKLGPKANQGAINAGLRALDRSGKPCRRWEKKGFQIKSFTGITWGLASWKAPRPAMIDPTAEVNGDGSAVLTTDSDGKENKGSSAIESDKSNSGGDLEPVGVTNHEASSPAPAVALSA